MSRIPHKVDSFLKGCFFCLFVLLFNILKQQASKSLALQLKKTHANAGVFMKQLSAHHIEAADAASRTKFMQIQQLFSYS